MTDEINGKIIAILVAVIVLVMAVMLVLAIFAAVGLYFWVGAYMQPEEEIVPPPMMTAQCVNAGENTNGTIIISNIGPGEIDANTLKIVVDSEEKNTNNPNLAESETTTIQASKINTKLYAGTTGTVYTTNGGYTTFLCKKS